MYKLILQQQKQSTHIKYFLTISKKNQNSFGFVLEIVGKYIIPYQLQYQQQNKKLIIYKIKLNKWLASGILLTKNIEKLLKKVGILF
jgi:ribosomal protein S16